MSIDLERLTHPLRLASGSHQPGSGKGCAMNVVSYTNGDTQITDYPSCSARPLAAMVQIANDMMAGTDGFLSPEDSVTALQLGWATVGTADVDPSVPWLWVSGLLIDAQRGVVNLVSDSELSGLIRRAGELCIACAEGRLEKGRRWYSSLQMRSVRDALKTYPGGTTVDWSSSAKGAAYSATIAEFRMAGIQASGAMALHVARTSPPGRSMAFGNVARNDYVAWAIQYWRDLAGLDQGSEIALEDIDSALARISN